MNPEKNINKKNKLERKESGFYHKIDEANERIYLGGGPERLGEFLGRLDVEKNLIEPQRRKEELERKIQKWIFLLEEYVKADSMGKEDKIPGKQLNFGMDRVYVHKPQELRLLEKMGLKKLVEEGKVNDLPALIFQYLLNGPRGGPSIFEE